MYLVISKWEILPGHDDSVIAPSKAMRNLLRARPEVEFVHSMRTESGEVLVAMGYRSEGDYQKLIQDPEGPFVRALKEFRLEDHMKWVWSERGEALAE